MLKILIVDNEAAIRRGLVQMMDWEAAGCAIVGQAVDGIDALEQIAALRPDIVISDIRMPGMDGLKLAEELHKRDAGIQVIILTGYPDFTYAQRAISYGVVDYVLKPTTPEDLLDALDAAKKRIEEQLSRVEISRQLADERQENSLLQRSLFLNELIHAPGMDPAYAEEQCRRLGIVLKDYQVLRVHVDFEGGSQEEAQTMQEEAQLLLDEALFGTLFTTIQRSGQNSYYVVENLDAPKLAAACHKVVHTVDKLLHCRLTIGISNTHHRPQDLPQAAWQARQAQQFAAYSSLSVAVPYSEIPAASRQDLEAITGLLEQLRSAIELSQRARADELLAQIFQTVRAARLPMSEVHKIGTFAVHFCVDSLFTLKTAQSLSQLPSTRAVQQSETVDEMESSLHRYIAEVMDAIPAAPDNLAEAVAKVKQYIARNYASELTLESLAQTVYLSPSYLSKIFKKETGENLSSHIQQVRIEKAKELLLNTNLKSFEVAEQVGIADPVYFARMFKRLTGTKPKDYRREHQNQG